MTEQEKIDICLNCQKPQKACASCVDWLGDIKMSESQTRVAIRKLHALGLVDREIAMRIGKAQSTVQKIRVKMGLEANGVTRVIDRTLVKNLYDRGYNDCEIARKVVCSSLSVFGWRQRNNLPPNAKRGERRKTHEQKRNITGCVKLRVWR